MFALFALLSAFQFASASPLSIQQEWQDLSDPRLMGSNFETHFEQLPREASLNHPQKNWSGDFWALNKGLINYRWNASAGFTLPSPDKEQALRMSLEKISQLSPAEKFDLLNARYTYPLKEEVSRYTNYGAKKWEGLCHGWAPASMNHNEPTAKVLKNKDGILIPFGSADIKALLSYYYAYPYQVSNTRQMGRRCDWGMVNIEKECKQDLNAGAFHIVLANKIALRNEGFIADMDRYKQIWNQPIIAYNSVITDEGGPKYHSAPGTVKTVRVKTTITYVYASKNSWNPLMGTEGQVLKKQKLKYVLDLNQQGEIIGGFWRSLERPDFLWVKEAPVKFTEDYVRLAELLND